MELDRTEIAAAGGTPLDGGAHAWPESVGVGTVEAVIRGLSHNNVPVLMAAEQVTSEAAAAVRIPVRFWPRLGAVLRSTRAEQEYPGLLLEYAWPGSIPSSPLRSISSRIALFRQRPIRVRSINSYLLSPLSARSSESRTSMASNAAATAARYDGLAIGEGCSRVLRSVMEKRSSAAHMVPVRAA